MGWCFTQNWKLVLHGLIVDFFYMMLTRRPTSAPSCSSPPVCSTHATNIAECCDNRLHPRFLVMRLPAEVPAANLHAPLHDGDGGEY